MPFTPFHFGPAMLLGLLLFEYVDFPTLLVASVIVDAEPIIILVFGINLPMHGFLHSFLLGSFVAIALSAVMMKVDGRIAKIMGFFGMRQKKSMRSVLLASFLGVYTHVLLDSSLGYPDIRPLLPSTANPFYNPAVAGFVLYACIISFFAAFILYAYRVLKRKWKP